MCVFIIDYTVNPGLIISSLFSNSYDPVIIPVKGCVIKVFSGKRAGRES